MAGVSLTVRGEAVFIAGIGQRAAGGQALSPKSGAQFHFDFPGAVQGFQVTGGDGEVANVAGHSETGARSLQVTSSGAVHCGSPVFVPDLGTAEMKGYVLMASPRIHAGQTVRVSLSAGNALRACLYVRAYGTDDETETFYGDAVEIAQEQTIELAMLVPPEANPVFEVGVKIEGSGTAYIDWLTWDGNARCCVNATSPQREDVATRMDQCRGFIYRDQLG